MTATPQDTVYSAIDDQIRRSPHLTALAYKGHQMSYGEVGKRVDNLAQWLIRSGEGTGRLVGVCMERGPEMVVAVLAVLKAGAAFVPLDPATPRDRLRLMIADADIRTVISTERMSRQVPDEVERVLNYSEDWTPAAHRGDDTVSDDASRPSDLAYVIYTSGSTGQPKGVMVEHASLAYYLDWAASTFPPAPAGGYGSLLHTPLWFDFTLPVLFVPLMRGEPLYLLDQDATITEVANALTGPHRYGFVRFTPSHLRLVLDELAGRPVPDCHLVVGGEVLPPQLVEEWHSVAPGGAIVNHYGPSEAVIGRCVFAADPAYVAQSHRVPVGYPIAQSQVYILDELGRPVQAGIPGEICLGGPGLARGYLNRPALTAERFVPDPFSKVPGAQMYRTGDRGRIQTDGALEFLGRFDDQVKVRGYRVELGDVESHLRTCPGVTEAAVALIDDRLVGHFTAAASTVGPDELRQHLIERVPQYMIPERWVRLDVLPRSANGKVDRRVLAFDAGAERSYEPPANRQPATPTEHRVAAVWTAVLSIHNLGANDNFFDLGGSSILALKVTAACRAAGLDVRPEQLLRHQTVARLAAALDAGDR